MESEQRKPFSETVIAFHGRPLPEAAIPVGYAALIDAFELAVPAPIRLAAIGPRHKVYEADGWKLYTPRHRPEFSQGPDQTYYQVMFESPDRVLFEVVYTGPKQA